MKRLKEKLSDPAAAGEFFSLSGMTKIFPDLLPAVISPWGVPLGIGSFHQGKEQKKVFYHKDVILSLPKATDERRFLNLTTENTELHGRII